MSASYNGHMAPGSILRPCIPANPAKGQAPPPFQTQADHQRVIATPKPSLSYREHSSSQTALKNLRDTSHIQRTQWT